MPLPVGNEVFQDLTAAGCNPNDAADCIDGSLTTRVRLAYPHIQVAGLNMGHVAEKPERDVKIHGRAPTGAVQTRLGADQAIMKVIRNGKGGKQAIHMPVEQNSGAKENPAHGPGFRKYQSDCRSACERIQFAEMLCQQVVEGDA